APAHQRLARKPRVGPQNDSGAGPALADLADDALKLLDRAGRPVDVRRAQLRAQKLLAAEDVQRQVAVVIVVAVKEALLLRAVQRRIGRIQIQYDLLGRLRIGVQKQLYEQPLDCGRVGQDLVIERKPRPGKQLQAVQRALAGKRLAVLALRLELAKQHAKQRILAQLIVIVQILISQRQRKQPLAQQRAHRMLDQLWVASVNKTARQAIDQSNRIVRALEQQRSSLRGDPPAIKGSHHPATLNA